MKKRKKGLSLESKIKKKITDLTVFAIGKQGKVFRSKSRQIVNSTRVMGAAELSRIRDEEYSISLHSLENALSVSEIKNSLITCSFPTNRQIKDNVKYKPSGKGERFDIAFEAIVLSSFGKEIKGFLNLKNNFDNALLSSNLNDAKVFLQSIKENFGYSNWYESSKLNLMIEEGDNNKFFEYHEDVLKDFKENQYNTLSEIYIEYPFIRCDKGVSYERYKFAILHQMEDFIITKKPSTLEIIDFSHLYTPDKKYSYISELVCENSSCNIVDRYLGFRRIILSSFLHDNYEVIDCDSIYRLYKVTNDDLLRRILYLLGYLDIEITELDISTTHVCDLYVQGKYEDAIKAIESILSDNPTFTVLIEMYVKSLIRVGRLSEPTNLLSLLVNQIVSLYSNEAKYENIKSLQKEFIRFYHNDWAFFIKLQCEKFTTTTKPSTLEFIYKFLDLNCSLGNTFSTLRFSSKDIHGKGIDGVSISAMDIDNIINGKVVGLSSERIMKIKADHFHRSSNYSKALPEYIQLAKSHDSLFVEHALSRKISCLFYTNKVQDAINETAELIKLYSNAYFYSLHEISNFIIKSKRDNKGSNITEFINRAIVLHAYNIQKSNENISTLSLLCEDILERLGISCVTELTISAENVFFFEYVLTPEVMETFDIFNSHKEVFIFRLTIIQQLISLRNKNEQKGLKIELFRMIERLVKETCVIDCGVGRIEVDFLSVKNNASLKFTDEYNLLKKIEKKNFNSSDYITIRKNNNSYEYSSNELYSKTLELYYKIRDEYTISPLYGLDNFLNTNIRHGGIVNLLWGPIKKHKLAYLKNDKNIFEREGYWFEYYMYLNKNKKDKLDQAFRVFTKAIEKEIIEAKSWVHINTGEFPDDGKAFNFFSDTKFIESAALTVNNESNFESFLNLVIDDLINQTNESLVLLKNKIKTTLAKNIDNCFEILINDIENIAPLDELKKRVRLTQREMNERNNELISWMEWKNETTQSFFIGSSIDAAKDMIQTLHPNMNVNIDFLDHTRIFIDGKYFRKFVTIFLILIDNAVVHAKVKTDLYVSIRVEYINDRDVIISIFNNVSSDVLDELHEKLSVISEKINKSYIESANGESGSGLFKVKKIFTFDMDVKSNITFNIDKDNNMFNLFITFDTQGLNDD